MRIPLVFISVFILSHVVTAQERVLVGFVVDARTKKEIPKAIVQIENTTIKVQTNSEGKFQIVTAMKEEFVISIATDEYITQRIQIVLQSNLLNLGKIYLERTVNLEQTNNLITLTDAELFDDEINSNSSGIVQATRDIFLSRAAFDFGQAFFRVRGYDSQNGKVLVNGITMNKLFDGRPQWNNWGGLNDVTRNQQFTNGLSASDFTLIRDLLNYVRALDYHHQHQIELMAVA